MSWAPVRLSEVRKRGLGNVPSRGTGFDLTGRIRKVEVPEEILNVEGRSG